jgi:phosphoribosylamine--glycine ligase
MKILVVGGGGREHAIIKSLKKNPLVTEIFALPGNGGIAADAVCVPINAKEIEKIRDFAVENKIDFAVVAPDDPLCLGAVDLLEDAKIKCFGPSRNAAVIEGSKAFAKNLMKKYRIPTAEYEVFTDAEAALLYLDTAKIPVVVKADGLALGKGVVVAETREQAKKAVTEMLKNKKFGASGTTVIIEEYLEGPEVSVLSFTDGNTVVPMISSMDHKRALDSDKGLNTGGMGTVAPNPYYTADIAAECMEKIFLPTVNAMKNEGRTFKGCLYFGLMLTKDGPKVIEYNCRFGDPETQVVLPLLKTDLLTVMQKVSEGKLSDADVEFYDKSACCVVLASKGYPEHYETGYEIMLPAKLKNEENIYVAGAKLDGKILKTSGGRVLNAVATAKSLKKAVGKAYKLADKIHFENAYRRSDIGKRALDCLGGKK